MEYGTHALKTYTAKQVRMAQDLAVELEHINRGIPLFIQMYDSAPSLLTSVEDILEFLDNGTPVHPGSDLHSDLKIALSKCVQPIREGRA